MGNRMLAGSHRRQRRQRRPAGAGDPKASLPSLPSVGFPIREAVPPAAPDAELRPGELWKVATQFLIKRPAGTRAGRARGPSGLVKQRTRTAEGRWPEGDAFSGRRARLSSGACSFRAQSDPIPSNHAVEANRRPAGPFEADCQFGWLFCARPGLPAAVASPDRSVKA